MIDKVSVDYAFFGELDQTSKLILILNEQKCRWTEALLVENKRGQDTWVVKPVADISATNRTAETHLKIRSRSIDGGLDAVAELVEEGEVVRK